MSFLPTMENCPLSHCGNNHRCIVVAVANNRDHRRRRRHCYIFGHLLFVTQKLAVAARKVYSRERRNGCCGPKLSLAM
jgi:hypothetical protein